VATRARDPQKRPSEYDEIVDVFSRFRLCKSWLITGGGQGSRVSERIDSELLKHGWQFENSVTRRDELQEIFDELGREASYGASTTHMSKLLPRIRGGGGAGCPLLVLGIRKSLYDKGS